MNTLDLNQTPRSPTALLPVGSIEETALRKRMKPVASLAVLHAHALAIEHEAESRYRELAQLMADRGNAAVAVLFSQLADFEAQHAFHWTKRSVGVEIPVIAPEEYAWLDCGAPLPDARAFVYRMMTPRLALEMALRAEERALNFFERVADEADNAGVRDLAKEMAREEQSHIAWVQDALAREATPFRPTEEQPADPAVANEV